MQCPFCRTENRDDRDKCYHCDKDLTMLRVIIRKARSHFNAALEFAERSRDEDAITELNNALDLDYSHVSSHVVLGTLYARLGRMDEAEEHWREALRLDPQLEKAHDYLAKLKTVRRSLPIVHRQRVLIGFMLGVLVCFAALLWKFNAPNPNLRRLEQAWEFYQRGRYGDAQGLVREARAVKHPDFYATTTMLVGDLVEAEQALVRRAVKQELESGNYVSAARQARELLGRHPSVRVKMTLDAALGRARELARVDVDRALEAFASGRATDERVAGALEAYKQASGSDADGELVQAVEGRLAKVRRDREIGAALGECRAAGADPWACLEKLSALRQRYPDDSRLGEAFENIMGPLRLKWTGEFQSRLDRGDLTAAAEALEPLGRVLRYSDPAGAPARIRELEGQVTAAQRARGVQAAATRRSAMEEALRTAYEGGDDEKAVEAGTALLAEKGLDATTRAVATKMVEKANVRLANRRWEWLEGRSGEFIDCRMDIETAEKMLRWYPQIRDHLSKRVYPTSHDNLLFFAAMAYRKLDRRKDYADALARLVREYPDTNCMRWVRVYEKKDGLTLPKQ